MKMKHILLAAFGSILLLNCNSAMEETAAIKPDAMTTEEHEHETDAAKAYEAVLKLQNSYQLYHVFFK